MKRRTASGTDIEEVKKLNNASGLAYNEVKNKLAEQYRQKTKNQSPPTN
ncbi:hypothetical protein WAK64_16495 [Bacillus spongiae]|uniref:DNA mismatch repair protein MutT n=1 Tax=Bacillus spongiae TaxID=2683610 RepID=A0ABU8HGY5_9BACI